MAQGKKTPTQRARQGAASARERPAAERRGATPKTPRRPGRKPTALPAPPQAPETAPAPEPAAPASRRATAESLAARQREISISEFFTKNRHLLGFDNPVKALLTAIKEAVDNSLDACEEAGILPEIEVAVEELAENRYRVTVRDNGPGIVKQQIPKIFGKLLYGSKFHTLKMSRGQQGIGISAAALYAQLTTGKPVAILSRTGSGKPAHYYEIHIDTRRNAPEVVRDEKVEWSQPHGTQVVLELEAVYRRGPRSVDDYLEQTAIANPHARLVYRAPKADPVTYDRVSEVLPREPLEIKPHPHGVELGALITMLKDTSARSLRTFLTQDFSRVSDRVALAICEKAGLDPNGRPREISKVGAEALHRAIPQVKIMAPPSACLSPMGEENLLRGLKRIPADLTLAVSRPPAVYRGNPFIIEAGLAFGGDQPAEEPIRLMRFANRVPLQYQQAACSITKAVVTTPWRNYGLTHPRGALPLGPVTLMVHIASVWVPFTSESKEAVAHYPEILREIRLALMELGRKTGGFIRHRERQADLEKKRNYLEKYVPHISEALKEILGLGQREEERVTESLQAILGRPRPSGTAETRESA